jgi:hypothetical protein
MLSWSYPSVASRTAVTPPSHRAEGLGRRTGADAEVWLAPAGKARRAQARDVAARWRSTRF